MNQSIPVSLSGVDVRATKNLVSAEKLSNYD